MSELIESTPQGLYCAEGGFWIDPWRAVSRAVVTHAHTDHARYGCERYLTSATGKVVLAARLGPGAAGRIDGLNYGRAIRVGDVLVSLHPAGHVLGSAQVRVQRLSGPRAGEVWVASGDYKLALDGVSEPFEPVRCDTFITESTFGLPVYRWPHSATVMASINAWWAGCGAVGKLPILACYALGKAQRLLAGLDASIGPILIHGALKACTQAYVDAGVKMPLVASATHENVQRSDGRAIVLAPPSAVRSAWAYKLPGREHALASAMASGWMSVRGTRRRQALDTGFPLSDHADWPGLLAAIEATGATRVGVTHGYIGPMVRQLRERGLDAFPIETRYEGDNNEAGEASDPPPAAELVLAAELSPASKLVDASTVQTPALIVGWSAEPAGAIDAGFIDPAGRRELIEEHRAGPAITDVRTDGRRVATIRSEAEGSPSVPRELQAEVATSAPTETPGAGYARFARLFLELDATTKTGDKHELLVAYFRHVLADRAPADRSLADGIWTVALFTGRRVKRAVTRTQLREWVGQLSGLPAWLIDECYATVGDFGETLALLLPSGPLANQGPTAAEIAPSLADVCQRLMRMVRMSPDACRREVVNVWSGLDQPGRLVFHKLISASFRLGVSRMMVVRALAHVAGITPPEMDQRLMGEWPLTGAFFASLLAPTPPVSAGSSIAPSASALNPLPFFLAHQLPDELDRPDLLAEALGPVSRWQAEWKWDGLRAQLICQAPRVALWSRGEEPLGEQFPELIDAARALPTGTILDGEVLAFEHGMPLDFAHIQTRITARRAAGRLFHDVPVVFMAYDLLRSDGVDVRALPMARRRALLDALLPADIALIKRSPVIDAESWAALELVRAQSRARGVEGLMLKRLDSPYGTGRAKLSPVDDKAAGAWWKWKIEPYSVDCVLVAAQRGSGRRASLFTDYTFAVWSGQERGEGELIPFAKAYHGKGMTDEIFMEIDAFVRTHTTGRIPAAGIRNVRPLLVFELAFEGLQESPRHRSKVAVRFPRINRWRRDKAPAEADTLGTLRAMLLAHRTRTQPAPGQVPA